MSESESENEEFESQSYGQTSPPVGDDESILESVGSNPRAHLLHNGKWKAREYNVGRLVKGTGIWYCFLTSLVSPYRDICS
jgi:hypothetical protein